jgi:hypothetical protein
MEQSILPAAAFVYLFICLFDNKLREGRGEHKERRKKDALASRKAWLLDRTKLKRESREKKKIK